MRSETPNKGIQFNNFKAMKQSARISRSANRKPDIRVSK